MTHASARIRTTRSPSTAFPAGLRAVAAAVGLALAAVVLALAGGVLSARPADAAAKVTVTSSLGQGLAAADKATPVTVTGSGFQSVKGGFGGVYVLFGWVDDPSGGSWRPSKGGKTGTDLLYVPDSESTSNAGYQRFVAFPGSSTEESANGGEISAAGTISLRMVIPGATFTTQDASGATRTIDCRAVRCGIITIGAHGVANATNESFTPVTFAGTTGSGASSAPAGTSRTVAASGTAAAPSGAASAVGQAATVGLGQQTYQAGRVVSFTGQGFAPGEQVVVTLSAGLAGAGPLTAGRFGEVSGALTLPADTRAGTHVVRLQGAGSGRVAQAELSVMASGTTVATAETPSPWWTWATVAATVATGLVLIVVVASLVTTIARRRRARRAGQQRVRRTGTPSGGGR